MNKRELIRKLQIAQGGSYSAAKVSLDALIAIVTDELKEGHEIAIQGFGTLRPWHQSGREARNPKTGDKVHINPRTSVKFSIGKYLLDTLNEK